jgi:hypothetical protein
MKYLTTLVLSLGSLTLSSYGQTLVNDTWADGSRAEQNLPTESQWFGARATNFITTAGSMTFLGDTTSSRGGVTYFTAAGSPVTLADGQSLTATLVFTLLNVGAANTSQNMRFGLFDYSGGTRMAADGSSASLNGANVTGYGLWLTITPTFNGTTAMVLNERTTTTTSDLLGASGAWTSLNSGGGIAISDPGYASGNSYTMVYTATRNGTGTDLSATITGPSLSLALTANDPSGSFSFDAFGFRSSNTSATAERFQFTEFKVEITEVPEPTTIAMLGIGAMGLIIGYRRFRG